MSDADARCKQISLHQMREGEILCSCILLCSHIPSCACALLCCGSVFKYFVSEEEAEQHVSAFLGLSGHFAALFDSPLTAQKLLQQRRRLFLLLLLLLLLSSILFFSSCVLESLSHSLHLLFLLVIQSTPYKLKCLYFAQSLMTTGDTRPAIQ